MDLDFQLLHPNASNNYIEWYPKFVEKSVFESTCSGRIVEILQENEKEPGKIDKY